MTRAEKPERTLTQEQRAEVIREIKDLLRQLGLITDANNKEAGNQTGIEE